MTQALRSMIFVAVAAVAYGPTIQSSPAGSTVEKVASAVKLSSGFILSCSDAELPGAAADIGRRMRRTARTGRKARMQNLANARFAIKRWDESPYVDGADRPKLTRASVTKTYTGDIEGDGHVEYLMMYRSDGSATFVGLEVVTGKLGGMSGSFVLQRVGTFEGGQARETYTVIPGSATGDLLGLTGGGSSAVGHGMEHPFSLDYRLP